MALKHWGGSVPSTRVAWKCPTCGTDNTTPLEAGCPACGAGKGNKGAAEQGGVTVNEADDPFVAWLQTAYPLGLDTFAVEVARKAWNAAFLLGSMTSTRRDTTTPAAPTPLQGGWVLAMVHPDTHDPTLTDQRTHDTVVAALAFYRDNQLAYGVIPGQLTAEETSALIDQLHPREEPAV